MGGDIAERGKFSMDVSEGLKIPKGLQGTSAVKVGKYLYVRVYYYHHLGSISQQVELQVLYRRGT